MDEETEKTGKINTPLFQFQWKQLQDTVKDFPKDYIDKEIFELRMARVEKLVYGAASIILVAVFSALVYLVVKK